MINHMGKGQSIGMMARLYILASFKWDLRLERDSSRPVATFMRAIFLMANSKATANISFSRRKINIKGSFMTIKYMETV